MSEERHEAATQPRSMDNKWLQMESERIRLEYWRLNVFEKDQQARHISSLTIQTGHIGLKLVSLINAGALIAVPSFLKAFSPNEIVFVNLKVAMVLFVLGVVSSFVAILGAYYTNFRHASEINFERSLAALDVNLMEQKETEEDRKIIENLNKNIQFQNRSRSRWQMVAVGFALLGVFLFCVGSAFGVLAVG